jgi:RimJ/RimL family protein N-acetyltransferase
LFPALETRRLVLRPIELADAEPVQLLFPHWEVVRYLQNRIPWPYPPDGALLWIRDQALPAIERGEEWTWTLRLKSAAAHVIGSITLRINGQGNRGFWLGLPWHGQGFMTEAAEAATDFWFEVLKFRVMRVPKAAPNAASRRISVRQGMRIVKTEDRDYVGGRFLTEIWEITAEEWRARNRQR